MSRHARSTPALIPLVAVFLIGIAAPVAAADAPPLCVDRLSDNLLQCVAAAVDTASASGQTAVEPPLKDALTKLAATEGYGGSPDDLDKLKTWSRALKQRDRVAYRDTISLLDNAIASHDGELRSAVSTQAAAKQALSDGLFMPGTPLDIHPLFVRRKLAFLDSEKAAFYDGGPFEAVRRSLLANALEESYFMASAENADRGVLRREIQIVDALGVLYDNPPAYIRVTQKNLQKSSNSFWRASILFALGDKAAAAAELRGLATDNRYLGLESRDPGHVYSYRVFDRPYPILLVSRGESGQPVVETKDPGLVNRFFNPAQLALVACAELDGAGTVAGITKYADAVTSLSFHDFYVVVAAAREVDSLQRLNSAMQRVARSAAFRARLDKLVATVNSDTIGFAGTVARGARLCGVEDAVRNDIVSAFSFDASIAPHDETRRLLLGGRLDANQASAVVDFVKSVLDAPDLRTALEAPGVTATVFAARMPMDAVRMPMDIR
jgi:hypothetical protein